MDEMKRTLDRMIDLQNRLYHDLMNKDQKIILLEKEIKRLKQAALNPASRG